MTRKISVARLFQRPLIERVRRLCLAFPETHEAMSWGHPNFLAGKKTFCAFEIVTGRPSIAFRLSPADVDAFLRRPNFFATPYGRGLWVSAWADTRLSWTLMKKLLDCSYRLVANKRMVRALDASRRAENGEPRSVNDRFTTRIITSPSPPCR